MNKLSKPILLISLAVLGTGFLALPSISRANSTNLAVQFETGLLPLFSEANFLPGAGITRWVKVTNNSASTQKIATEAINATDTDALASQMNLTIKEGVTTLYNDTLANFFANGETYLSDLAGGATTQYDFTVAFNYGAGNLFQGEALGFDLLIGFQGTDGGLSGEGPNNITSNSNNGGGGGGSVLVQGLTILEESVRAITVADTSAVITWTTSYQSTSQVIYGREDENHILDLSDNAGTPPKYGYAHTTPEYDVISKVTGHSVTVTGLTPGATYYFRAVSHGSFALSGQYSFTTLASSANTQEESGQETEQITGETRGTNGEAGGGTETEESLSQAPGEEAANEALSQGNEIIAQGESGQTGNRAGNIDNDNQAAEQDEAGLGTRLLAAIAAIPLNLNTVVILLFIIVFCLIILELFGKKEKKIKVNK